MSAKPRKSSGNRTHNVIPFLILAMGACLWATATTMVSSYARDNYYDRLQIRAVGAAARIENYFNSYGDLVESFHALYEASDSVSKDELERYFSTWKVHHLSTRDPDSVLFYGWHSLENPANSFYLNARNHNYNVSFKKVAKDKHEDEGFIASENVPYISFKNKTEDRSNILIISKDYDNSRFLNRKGHFFIAVDKDRMGQNFQNSFVNDVSKVSFTISWDAKEKANTAITVYEHEMLFGNKKLWINFHPINLWNFWSTENIAGIITAISGLIIVLLLFLYVSTIARRSATAERDKDIAEQKLEEQSQYLENFLENLPGILFIKDIKSNFKYFMFNNEAADFFGHTREELIGKNDYDFFKQEEADFFRTMDEATMAGRKVIDIPCEVITTHAGEFFLHTRKVPVYDSEGNPQFLIGLSQDITQRKKNEMELAEYRANLENIVDERTNKLRIATIKAEEASRLKSEFLATMSHEIRSPMSGVLGMAELLLDTPMSAEQQNLTKTILNSGEVLMNIIEDILDFSKIEANKLELDPIAVNMLDLVDDVCMLYSSRARDKALEIVVHYMPGTEQFVYADPIRMRQILGNVVNNAIKFTNKGHIVIAVSEEKNDLIPEDKVKLVFNIQDTGIGIEEKDRERIFEKFSQANSSTTRNYGGTGLGLSICKKLVEMMDGTLMLESEVGKGSNFKITIPMTRNREEVFIQPNPPILKDLRVLVVDDLDIIGVMLKEQLSMAGMVCDTAINGSEALSKMTKANENGNPYDLAIIDYLMPDMNGEMLARAINDEPDLRKTCLVMLTASGNPIVGDDFAEKGFSAYISKPVKTINLIHTLAVVWEKFKQGHTGMLIRVDTAALNGSRIEDTIRLDGSKILLVEDSRLNQAFAEEVLSQLGCMTKTVSNGQEAVNAVQEDEFDLILMDCQMPIMDGFEASRQISRMKSEDRVRKDLPIIALTANAMKGDRERCVAAGMDDYITKPVRKKELKEKIYYWIKKEQINVKDEDESHKIESEPSDTILDHAALSEARALLKDKFDFLLGAFIEDVESYIHEMEEALAKHDVEGVIRPAHTIKSTSMRMGAIRLSNIAKDIEIAAKEAANGNKEDPAITENIRRITSIFKETKETLKKAV